jgi:hypothetical protein
MFETVIAKAAEIVVLVERTIQFVKTIINYNKFVKYQKYIDTSLSVGLSAAACYLMDVNLLAAAGFTFKYVTEAGPAVTGILIGLGSNILHEVIEILKLWRKG